jgi:hypothetical protein
MFSQWLVFSGGGAIVHDYRAAADWPPVAGAGVIRRFAGK